MASGAPCLMAGVLDREELFEEDEDDAVSACRSGSAAKSSGGRASGQERRRGRVSNVGAVAHAWCASASAARSAVPPVPIRAEGPL